MKKIPGHLSVDGDGRAIQNANFFSTTDADGIASPLVVSALTEIKIPENAINFVITFVENDDLKVGETSSLSSYITVPNGTAYIGMKIPCAGIEKLYLDKVTANSTVNFMFEYV